MDAILGKAARGGGRHDASIVEPSSRRRAPPRTRGIPATPRPTSSASMRAAASCIPWRRLPPTCPTWSAGTTGSAMRTPDTPGWRSAPRSPPTRTFIDAVDRRQEALKLPRCEIESRKASALQGGALVRWAYPRYRGIEKNGCLLHAAWLSNLAMCISAGRALEPLPTAA
jgi:hypothetical protein